MASKPEKLSDTIFLFFISTSIILWLVSACTPAIPTHPSPTIPPPTDVPTAAQPSSRAVDTATPIPIETQTPTMKVTAKFWTPGPTPTSLQVSVLPGECEVSPPLRGNAIYVQRIGSTMCFVWTDEYDNEIGFRVMLQFGYNGEVFLYDLPANTTGLRFPEVLLEPPGQSFEYCIEDKNYNVNIYVLLPDQEPRAFTGYGFSGDCNRFDMPSATPQSTPTRTAAQFLRIFARSSISKALLMKPVGC